MEAGGAKNGAVNARKRLGSEECNNMDEIVLQKNPGNGLVLTRGRWSWDVQEQHHYQMRGTMQYALLPNFPYFTYDFFGPLTSLNEQLFPKKKKNYAMSA